MRRRPLALFAVLVVLIGACGGGDDGEDDATAPDDNVGASVIEDSGEEPVATVPTTTVTIPPEATEIPDLQIVFVEFGEAGYVVVANQGDDSAQLGGIHLCQLSVCVDLGTVVDGAAIAAGGSAEIAAATIGGLSIAGGEAALFSSSDVTDPDAIVAFVQWGTGGSRGEVAAAARIWPAGASVEPDPAFNSIELYGDPADPESWS